MQKRQECTTHHEKQLSYRKQIARELRTQYVDEGIYNNPVTLKPRLGVTQDH